jgi:uncharacterized protein (DUF58 family)
MIVLDASRSMAWTGNAATTLAKLEYASRVAAALSLVLLRQHDAAGLVVFDDAVRHAVPPRARMAHWHQIAAVLQGLGVGEGTAAEPALRRVMDFLRRRGLVVFISDLLLERDVALTALRYLRHRGHQVLVLHVMDPAEVSLSGPSEVRFEDPESRQSVTLRPADWADAYSRTIERVIHDWRAACGRFGIGYHQLLTTRPLGEALRDALAPRRTA